MPEIANMIFALVVLICLLFAAFATTRYIAQRSFKAFRGKHMRVLEIMSIGFDRNIYLIEVGGKFVLISACGKTIQYITTLEQLDIDQAEETTANDKIFPGFKAANLEGMLRNIFSPHKNLSGENKDNRILNNNEKLKNLFSLHSRYKEDD